VRDETWTDGWSAALHVAAQGAATITEERRGTTLRDTRAIARRLGTSAVSLFVRDGFDNVKVSEIADHAGVTQRTFFRYFPTKETVVVDIWNQANSRLMELIGTVGPADAEILDVLADATMDWCAEQGDLMPALARLSDQSETLRAAVLLRTKTWEGHIAEALCVRFPDLDAEDAEVWAVVTMAMLTLMQYNATARRTSYTDSARDAFRRFRGLMS
jgi:AcrR family transcriptional regulator